MKRNFDSMIGASNLEIKELKELVNKGDNLDQYIDFINDLFVQDILYIFKDAKQPEKLGKKLEKIIRSSIVNNDKYNGGILILLQNLSTEMKKHFHEILIERLQNKQSNKSTSLGEHSKIKKYLQEFMELGLIDENEIARRDLVHKTSSKVSETLDDNIVAGLNDFRNTLNEAEYIPNNNKSLYEVIINRTKGRKNIDRSDYELIRELINISGDQKIFHKFFSIFMDDKELENDFFNNCFVYNKNQIMLSNKYYSLFEHFVYLHTEKVRKYQGFDDMIEYSGIGDKNECIKYLMKNIDLIKTTTLKFPITRTIYIIDKWKRYL